MKITRKFKATLHKVMDTSVENNKEISVSCGTLEYLKWYVLNMSNRIRTSLHYDLQLTALLEKYHTF